MPYEPTNWKSGDVVTSAKLNKIEAGIASGGVLVVTDTEGTLDKTWQEIHDAVFVVYNTAMSQDNMTGIFIAYAQGVFTAIDGNTYGVAFSGNAGTFVTGTPNGYPVYSQ